MTNLDTGTAQDIFVPAVGVEEARFAALRIAYVYLDWKNCVACPGARVRHVGLPVPLPAER
ncbi:MAG: hypothetical protein LC754_06100 [Acidobacteria bacterium]|nr:hypothetical protein [Acidobacteriota bacterium]